MKNQLLLENINDGAFPLEEGMISGLKQLGKSIRRIRRSRGITQESLAERVSLHRTYICGVERGRRNVTYTSLVKIASGLEMTVSEITREAEAGIRAARNRNSYDSFVARVIDATIME